MATITGLTAERMLEIEGASVVEGEVVNGELILTKHDGTTINAGSVIGPIGPQGPRGLGPIPGEIKLWPGDVLPDPALYGLWAWANGQIFDVSLHPLTAAHLAVAWKTANGLPDPGAGKFRVPDMRGYIPAGLDAMPVGAARANRVKRSEALIIAQGTGEDRHTLVILEIPSHGHAFRGNALPAHGHSAGLNMNTLPAHAHSSFNTAPQMKHAANFSRTGTGKGVSDIGNITGSSDPAVGYPVTAAASAGTPSGSVSVNGASAGTPSGVVDPVGGSADHENMQPTIFVPYIVKLDD